jgi:hypothetical protein
MPDAPPVEGHLCAALIGDGPQRCNRDKHDDAAHRNEPRRLRSCLEAWPECWEGEYSPSCCRFPKSCSADVYDPRYVTPAHVEAEDHFGIKGVPSSSSESSGPVEAETTEQPGAVRPDAPPPSIEAKVASFVGGSYPRPASFVDLPPVAPTPETEAADHGLFMHEVPRYLPSRGRRREEPEDPPGVDIYVDPGSPGSLPPIDEAAVRVGLFLRGFGDGKIMGREDGLPPLYARDLEVLAQAHDPNRRR